MALISPHAGYQYCGSVMGQVFSLLCGTSYTNAVILGPSHRVRFKGAALPDTDIFQTPLGNIFLSNEAAGIASTPGIIVSSDAHRNEHSLEVLLPFLQYILPECTIIPLLTGDIDPKTLADIIQPILKNDTVLIVSTDLSHFHPFDEAVRLDQKYLSAVETLDVHSACNGEACGSTAAACVLEIAKRKKWKPEILSYTNSGNTGGDYKSVVGYAGAAFFTRL